MKFFDVNVIAKYQGGTMDGSSGNYMTAFTETTELSYQSDGEDTDGNEVTLTRVFTSKKEFDSLCILDTNFKDTTIWRKETDVSSWENITSQAVLTSKKDGTSHFYKFPSIIDFYSLEIRVPNTVVANQEKSCGCIMAFTEIGDLYMFNDIDCKKAYVQKKLTLEKGGIVTVNKGFWWKFAIKSKFIGVQSQADILANVQNLGREFFIWINSGLESAKIEAQPYTFNDFIKCVYTGTPSPSFYKNYLNSVFEDQLTFEQTGMIK
jgi:hypothetical protein